MKLEVSVAQQRVSARVSSNTVFNPQQPATAEDVRERARRNTLINSLRTPRNNDRSCDREWRKYRDWVHRKRILNVIPPGPMCLTRENVDLYFSEVIANWKVQPDTARRVVSSLQRFADDLEYCDGSMVVHQDSLEKSGFVILHKTRPPSSAFEKPRSSKSEATPKASFSKRTHHCLWTFHNCQTVLQKLPPDLAQKRWPFAVEMLCLGNCSRHSHPMCGNLRQASRFGCSG